LVCRLRDLVKCTVKIQDAGICLFVIDINTNSCITVKAGGRLPPRSYLWTVTTQGHFCVMWYWTKVYKSTQEKQDYEPYRRK